MTDKENLAPVTQTMGDILQDQLDRPRLKPVDTSILRERISRAIFDPGQTEGVRGSKKTLTDWQTDAVMRVLGYDTTEGQP